MLRSSWGEDGHLGQKAAAKAFAARLVLREKATWTPLHAFPEGAKEAWGRLGAQSAEHLTSAQVTISQFTSLSPALGSLMPAQTPLQILCPPLSLSLCLPVSCCLSQK